MQKKRKPRFLMIDCLKCGYVLADILFGDLSPSGRLPLIFLKEWQDSPGGCDIAHYTEDIFVGYRLSCATFEYSDVQGGKSALTFFDVKSKVWVAEPGKIDALIGRSARHIRLKKRFTLTDSKA